MAATFNSDLVNPIGVVLASEALLKGVDMILAPTVCIPRSPLIGRGFESFSEDPHLAGSVAGAYINGIQSLGVGAVIKHYAAHDQSKWCHSNNAIMSERALREVHLMPFQVAIKDGMPWSVMTAYNRINGTHCSEDPFLLQHVLRKEWGWEGLVVSDCRCWENLFS
jgi:beta-glucosidase